MQETTIRDCILREMPMPGQKTALEFVRYLEENSMTFYRDRGPCWKDKIYFWVQFGEDCVCFIEINDSSSREKQWTVWSDDIGSDWLEKSTADETIRQKAWQYADHCGHCGSCPGGRRKVIFGREFDDICGCTFSVDNPADEDLPFLKTMVDIRKQEILSTRT